MSTEQEIVDRYMDGFRRSDHETVLACLTDDVVWHIHGFRTPQERLRSMLRSRTLHPKGASDLFTFRNGLIAQVDSYVTPLSADRRRRS